MRGWIFIFIVINIDDIFTFFSYDFVTYLQIKDNFYFFWRSTRFFLTSKKETAKRSNAAKIILKYIKKRSVFQKQLSSKISNCEKTQKFAFQKRIPFSFIAFN